MVAIPASLTLTPTRSSCITLHAQRHGAADRARRQPAPPRPILTPHSQEDSTLRYPPRAIGGSEVESRSASEVGDSRWARVRLRSPSARHSRDPHMARRHHLILVVDARSAVQDIDTIADNIAHIWEGEGGRDEGRDERLARDGSHQRGPPNTVQPCTEGTSRCLHAKAAGPRRHGQEGWPQPVWWWVSSV